MGVILFFLKLTIKRIVSQTYEKKQEFYSNYIFIFLLLLLSSWGLHSCKTIPKSSQTKPLGKKERENNLSVKKKENHRSIDSLKNEKVANTVEQMKKLKEPKSKILDNREVSGVDSLGKSEKNKPTNPLLSSNSIDSVPPPPSVHTDTFKVSLSKDSLDAPVNYGSKDSMMYDIANQKAFLYGNAFVTYNEFDLKADYIEIDFKKKLAIAEGRRDSITGQWIGKPIFKDKENEFISEKMIYNFETKKGKIYNAYTNQDGNYLLSGETKFISKGTADGKDDIIYSHHCTLTTCDAPHPHFGIKSSRAKIIPNKLIVVGSSYLSIADVPTPLVLPFGFFPITKKRKAGLIFPRDIRSNLNQEIGLQGIGYYVPINPYMDFTVTGGIFMQGSWNATVSTNYKRKYKADGNISLSHNFIRKDDRGTPDFLRQRDYKLTWTHRQDAAAHPSQSFSASVNLGTGTFDRVTSNTNTNVFNNTMNSSINYNKRWLGTPFSLGVGMTHSQNTRTRDFNMSLPQASLQMQQIFPFKRKKQVGKIQWYEQISFRYSAETANKLATKDTILFNAFNTWSKIKDQFRYGIKHTPQIGVSLKLLKYININPSINYGETWYFARDRKYLDPSLIVKSDTIFQNGEIVRIEQDTTFGVVKTERQKGFFAVRNYSMGVNLGTQLFGTSHFKLGRLRALRHVVSPTIGFSWSPDYSHYQDSVQADTRYPTKKTGYGYYDTELYGAPKGKQQALLTYNIGNLFEAKIKRDTTTKLQKINLLNNLNISGNYNFIADSLKFSPIAVNGNTTLLKFIGMQFGANFDPYTIDKNEKRLNTFQYDINKKLLRLVNANLTVSAALTKSMVENWLSKDKTNKTNPTENPYTTLQDFSIAYTFKMNYTKFYNRDTLIITNNIDFRASVNLSPKWNASCSFAYDIPTKRIVYPTITLARDLHCWQMGIDWQIERRTWAFFLRVKPGSLDFINIPARAPYF